jgi:hypothetical protein
VSDLVAEIGFSGLLHLGKNHSRNFLRGEDSLIALVLDNNGRFAIFLGNFERPVPDITLDLRIIRLATDKTLGVEYSVSRVGVESVLCRVADT